MMNPLPIEEWGSYFTNQSIRHASFDSWSIKFILHQEECLSLWNHSIVVNLDTFSDDKHPSCWRMILMLHAWKDEACVRLFVEYENHPLIGRMFIIVKHPTRLFFVTCKNQTFCNDTHPSWWRMIFILHELNHWICVRWFVKYENYPSMGRMFIIVEYPTHQFFVTCENQIFCNDTHPSCWRMILILNELNHWICVRWFVKYENHPSIGRMFIIVKYSTSPFFVACKNQIFHNDKHPSNWRMIFILHELNHWTCVRWFVKYENHPSIGRMFIIVKCLIFTRH